MVAQSSLAYHQVHFWALEISIDGGWVMAAKNLSVQGLTGSETMALQAQYPGLGMWLVQCHTLGYWGLHHILCLHHL